MFQESLSVVLSALDGLLMLYHMHLRYTSTTLSRLRYKIFTHFRKLSSGTLKRREIRSFFVTKPQKKNSHNRSYKKIKTEE